MDRPRAQAAQRGPPGDYLFVPAGLPHVAVNRGAVPATFVRARNEASIHEAADMRPELERLVP